MHIYDVNSVGNVINIPTDKHNNSELNIQKVLCLKNHMCDTDILGKKEPGANTGTQV